MNRITVYDVFDPMAPEPSSMHDPTASELKSLFPTALPGNPTPRQLAKAREELVTYAPRVNTIQRIYKYIDGPVVIDPHTKSVQGTTSHGATTHPFTTHVDIHVESPMPSSWREMADILYNARKKWDITPDHVNILLYVDRSNPVDKSRIEHFRRDVS